MPHTAVKSLTKISELNQSGDMQGMIAEGQTSKDLFLQRGLHLVETGLDKAFIHKTLVSNIMTLKRRNNIFVNMIRTMG